jgi:hypothetical protein
MNFFSSFFQLISKDSGDILCPQNTGRQQYRISEEKVSPGVFKVIFKNAN